MTAGEALESCRRTLEAAGIPDAGIDAGILLEYATGISRAGAMTHPETVIPDADAGRLKELTTKRAAGEPLAYITGTREFMGLEFHTERGVLIPRPDTETLVEEAMLHLHDGMRLMDLCTGTGCVALSLLHYSNETSALVTDIAPEAARLAERNAAKLGLSERIQIIECDLYPDIPDQKADIITANPPYIRTGDIAGLMRDVRDHEPLTALDGGEDGLVFYRRILEDAGRFLFRGGWLLVETGYDQHGEVEKLFSGAGFRDVASVKDLGGNYRVVKGCYY